MSNKTHKRPNDVTEKISPSVSLDACSKKYSAKITAKVISKNVTSNIKLLKDVSFG